MNYSIMPSEPGPLRRGGERPLERARVPLHPGAEMGLVAGRPLRDECWGAIGGRVRSRLLAHAGTVIEWWASEDATSGDGRPAAVVFGERGLSVAEPRLNTEHRPVYAVSAYLLGSFRHKFIDHRPPARKYGGMPGGSAGPDIGLSKAAKGLLGNLPPEAQELLQAPFLGGQKLLRCDWHYEGQEHHLSMFMMYLAGPRDVTVASGSKIVPAGHSDATAHWALTCRRASVVRRIGK